MFLLIRNIFFKASSILRHSYLFLNEKNWYSTLNARADALSTTPHKISMRFSGHFPLSWWDKWNANQLKKVLNMIQINPQLNKTIKKSIPFILAKTVNIILLICRMASSCLCLFSSRTVKGNIGLFRPSYFSSIVLCRIKMMVWVWKKSRHLNLCS